VIERTLAGLGEHVSPARPLALRAWLRHGAGDEAGAWEDLAAARLAELAADPDPKVAAAAEATRRRPPPLSLRVLGPFAVRRGSWTVDDAAWKRRVAQRVVRMLLVYRPDPVPEDVLFEALWPDRAPSAARRSLQVAVSCARAALDPPGAERSVIEGSGRAYRLVLGERDMLDAEVFRARRRARAAGARRPEPRAARACGRAVERRAAARGALRRLGGRLP
jgi:hypothetical protein